MTNPTYTRAVRKAAPVKSYVAAVRDLGDSWCFSRHSPEPMRISEAYATPDFWDYNLMTLMESGTLPRVPDRDLVGC